MSGETGPVDGTSRPSGGEGGTNKAALLDELAALDPATRREVATMLRSLANLAEEYRDGQPIAHTCGVLANLLDPPGRDVGVEE